MTKQKVGCLAIIGPGLLVAATGVGAGDLATASYTGSKLGTAVLWAVWIGALLKFALNEGLARWQLATGETLLEGMFRHLGRGIGWVFLPYLALWSFFVGAALVSACGSTLHAAIPVFEDAARAKIVFGALSSMAGLVLVLVGGFKLFEKVMSVCIGVMFVVVVVTAGLLWPGTGEMLRGLLHFSIPDAGGDGLAWTVALLGGVGGTVTVLCYGYWIREADRNGGADLRLSRIDLSVGYGMTALFGVAMIVIGAQVEVGGRAGSQLLVLLAEQLSARLGPVGRWAFLLGALGAVFSSLLGVWQAIPYLFADTWSLVRGRQKSDDIPDFSRTRPYKVWLVGIATVPMIGLFARFESIQKLYAIVGAAFIPALALVLLVLCRKGGKIPDRFANRWLAWLVLSAALLLFAWIGWMKVTG